MSDKLKLERVENTEFTFDVERLLPEGYVWRARIVFDREGEGIRITRGSLTLGELSAIRMQDSRILANFVQIVEI